MEKIIKQQKKLLYGLIFISFNLLVLLFFFPKYQEPLWKFLFWQENNSQHANRNTMSQLKFKQKINSELYDKKTHVHKCFPSNLKTQMNKEFSLHVKNWIMLKHFIWKKFTSHTYIFSTSHVHYFTLSIKTAVKYFIVGRAPVA